MIVCAKEVKALQIISAGVPWKCHDTHPKSEAESNTFMLLTKMLHAVINSRTSMAVSQMHPGKLPCVDALQAAEANKWRG